MSEQLAMVYGDLLFPMKKKQIGNLAMDQGEVLTAFPSCLIGGLQLSVRHEDALLITPAEGVSLSA